MKRSGVHIPLEYTAVFDQIFALICQSMLAAKCQNKSADFGQSEPTDFTKHCSVYNVHRFHPEGGYHLFYILS